MSGPIVIGVGGNLPTAEFGPPRATCGAALQVLSQHPGVEISAHAGWYETAPVPISDQPWFVNFALLPIRDVAPGWRHPLLGRTIEDLCADLPADQEIRPLADAGGYLGTEWQTSE